MVAPAEIVQRRRMLRPVAIFGIFLLLAAACGGDDAGPASTLNAYIAAYNSGDIDEVLTVFSEESEIIDHPFNGLVSGLDEIRRVHVEEFEFSAGENAYTVSNVQVSDNTVTWDHQWVNAGGVSYCIEGNTAVIEEGTIFTWTWPNGGVAQEC
jgi:hypothetical protein